MVYVNEYKIVNRNGLEQIRYELLNHDPYSTRGDTAVNLVYTIPIASTPRGPGNLGGTSIPVDKPINNKIFSLSGKTEEGSIEFEAFERFNPSDIDSVYNDRSYNPTTGNHTLDDLISGLENSTISGSDDEALKLKNRFQQDSSNNYVVRSVKEQRIWLKEYVQNPGLTADWNLFGGEYDWRTIDGSNNNDGTPIFFQSADIEPAQNTEGRGLGTIQFKVGDRL